MLRTLARLKSGESPFKLTMYTGTDCQLCQVMQHEISLAAKTVPIELKTYNIRDDTLPDVHIWRRKYQYDIPVLHLDQAEIFRHRLTAKQLIEKLTELEGNTKSHD